MVIPKWWVALGSVTSFCFQDLFKSFCARLKAIRIPKGGRRVEIFGEVDSIVVEFYGKKAPKAGPVILER